MMENEITVDKWDTIYAENLPGSFLRYPDSNLFTLINRTLKILPSCTTVLDYGFGSGNNTIELYDYFSEVYGIEISHKAISRVKKRLKIKKSFNENNFTLTSSFNYQNKFDLIICWNVFCYLDSTDFQETIEKIYSSLKKDGIFIASITSENDTKAINSLEETNGTYKISSKIPHQAGCNINFSKSASEVEYLFRNFKKIDLGEFTFKSFQNNGTSEFYFVGKKD